MRAGKSGPRENKRRIALAGDVGPRFLEAGATVDGPIQPGNKGHNSLAAARGADDGGHLSAVARCPLSPTGCPTSGTPLRFVEQALFQVEALLPSGEDELHFTITASYGLVFQSQFRSPPLAGFLAPLPEGPPGGKAGRANDRRGRSSASGRAAQEGLVMLKGTARIRLLAKARSNHSRVTAASIGQP